MYQLLRNAVFDLPMLAITVVVLLVITVIVYVQWWKPNYPSSKFSCPGLQPTDPELGNLGEITKKGGLHQFLLGYHRKLGPIFTFFWGKDVALSIASPTLFKDVEMLFDRSLEPFEVFKPLIGEGSIQFMNSDTGGRAHRKLHDRHYAFAAVKSYFEEFYTISQDLVEKWKKVKVGEHVALTQQMLIVAVKSLVRTSFGDEYFVTEEEIIEFHNAYHICWDEVEQRIQGDIAESGSVRDSLFNEKRDSMRKKIHDIICHRRTTKKRANNLLDALLDAEDLYPTEDSLIDMVITYLIGGFHTTGYLLSWAVYFLCLHPDIAEEVHKEIINVIGENELTFDMCKQLPYLDKVVNETLRCSLLAPTAARVPSTDIIVGGHEIPKNTPIITALGVVLCDPEIWGEDPSTFNPERFSMEQVKSRHPLSFQPFGFAGKRKCPGYRFAYYEAYVYLVGIFRNFKVQLVDGQDIKYRHGLVTQFTDEVWVTVEAR